MTKTIDDFTEPTAAQLSEKVYTLKQIRMQDVWLAAFLGSPVAQRVVECPNIHQALLDMQPKDIGAVLKIYDTEEKAVTQRVALILAMALLPKWQARFPDDPLGEEVVMSTWDATMFGYRHGEYDRLRGKICSGKYCQFAVSSTLGTLLGVANGRNELNLGDINNELQMDVQMLVALIGRKLVPWLLDRQEVSRV